MNETVKTGAITQQDFELFRQEVKSDFALFKQEMKSEYKSFQDSIKSDITDVISRKINQMATIVVGFISLFIIAYAAYFEYTHNSINKINHERAFSDMEKNIMAIINQQMIGTHDQRDIKAKRKKR